MTIFNIQQLKELERIDILRDNTIHMMHQLNMIIE